MSLIHPPGRRFHRTSEYTHEQRRNGLARIRERVDLVPPGSPPRSFAPGLPKLPPAAG